MSVNRCCFRVDFKFGAGKFAACVFSLKTARAEHKHFGGNGQRALDNGDVIKLGYVRNGSVTALKYLKNGDIVNTSYVSYRRAENSSERIRESKFSVCQSISIERKRRVVIFL